MKNIGFYGGSSIVELGPIPEMVSFFSVLNANVSGIRDQEIIDRLYQRYLRLNDLEDASRLFKKVFNDSPEQVKKTYAKYFDGFEHCVRSALGFYEDWNIYKPVKIVITDMPGFMVERDRSIEQYDALGPDDLPFWLR